MVPSGSLAEPSKDTASPAAGEELARDKETLGASSTSTACETAAVWPLLSVTTSVTMYVPVAA